MAARHYRQGDILLVEVGGVPVNAAREPRDGLCILARGERTGHHHSFSEEDAHVVRTAEGTRYVVLPSGGTLQHQEHGSIVIPPGHWRVVRQREYTRGPRGGPDLAQALGFKYVDD